MYGIRYVYNRISIQHLWLICAACIVSPCTQTNPEANMILFPFIMTVNISNVCVLPVWQKRWPRAFAQLHISTGTAVKPTIFLCAHMIICFVSQLSGSSHFEPYTWHPLNSWVGWGGCRVPPVLCPQSPKLLQLSSLKLRGLLRHQFCTYTFSEDLKGWLKNGVKVTYMFCNARPEKAFGKLYRKWR